ncbi:hypothetical protein C6499_19150 [Candidatus Poribacteria bacterium]|nr:MAG: hypothetical protein C6499_19150 [Candidatus Poribacteria bacterium]
MTKGVGCKVLLGSVWETATIEAIYTAGDRHDITVAFPDGRLMRIEYDERDPEPKIKAIDNLTVEEIVELYQAINTEAMAAGERGQFESAIEMFTRAINLSPNAPLAYYHRGSMKLAIDDNDGAHNDFSVCIVLNPDATGALRNRAILYLRRGLMEYQEALDDINTALALTKGMDLYETRGAVHVKMQNYTDAIKDFTSALRLSDDERDTIHILMNRAAVYALCGDSESAYRDYHRVTQADPLAYQAWIKMSDLASKMNRPRQAWLDRFAAERCKISLN